MRIKPTALDLIESRKRKLAARNRRLKRSEFVKLFGTIDFSPTWNYKQDRRRSRSR